MLPERTIEGSASIGIALFPEDGATKDGLLSAADAEMYAAKHGRQKLAQMLAGLPDHDTDPGNRK